VVDEPQAEITWHKAQETIERLQKLADQVQQAVLSRDSAQLYTLVSRQEELVAHLTDLATTWERDRQPAAQRQASHAVLAGPFREVVPAGPLADHQILESAANLRRTNLVNALLVRASFDFLADFLGGLNHLADEGGFFDCQV